MTSDDPPPDDAPVTLDDAQRKALAAGEVYVPPGLIREFVGTILIIVGPILFLIAGSIWLLWHIEDTVTGSPPSREPYGGRAAVVGLLMTLTSLAIRNPRGTRAQQAAEAAGRPAVVSEGSEHIPTRYGLAIIAAIVVGTIIAIARS